MVRHRVEQLAGDGGHAAQNPALCVHGDELVVRTRQHKHRRALRRKQPVQADGLGLLAAHHVHFGEIREIHRAGEIAHARNERDRERRDILERLLLHRRAKVRCARRGRHMRDFQQAQRAGDHAVGHAPFHVRRGIAVARKHGFNALAQRRAQAAVVPVDGGMAHAALRPGRVDPLQAFVQQRHAQIGGAAVHDQIAPAHLAASHARIASVNSRARASIAASSPDFTAFASTSGPPTPKPHTPASR